MAQASPTTCAHNAPGQALVPGRPVPCRQCGALIEPSPRAVNSGGQLIGGTAPNALYPEDAAASSAAWAFAQ